jgi:hypothetical protein
MRSAALLAQRVLRAGGPLPALGGAAASHEVLSAPASLHAFHARWLAADAPSGGGDAAAAGGEPKKRRGRPPKAKPAEAPSDEAAVAAPSSSEQVAAAPATSAAAPVAAAPAAPAAAAAAAPAPRPPRHKRPPFLEGAATLGSSLPLRPEEAGWHGGITSADLLDAPHAVGAYFDVAPGLAPEASPEFYHDPLLADERGVRQVDYGCKGVAAEFEATGRRALLHRPAIAALVADVAGGAAPRIFLDGWTGAGKSAALYALVHWARAAGWVVMYVPSATLMVQGGRFYREGGDDGGEGDGLWDTPEAARHVINALLGAHGDALKSIPAPAGAGGTLADVAAAGLAAAAPRGLVDAAIALKDGLLEGAPGVRTLVVVDDYNALYNRTTYHEPMHAFHRRPIAPSELRLAAAFRVLEANPNPKRGGGGGSGVAVVAPTFGAGVSPALRIPRGRAATLRVPRYALPELAVAAAALAEAGAIASVPPEHVLRRALALTNGNAKELREAAGALLHEDDPLGPSLGYKARAAARAAYNTAMM